MGGQGWERLRLVLVKFHGWLTGIWVLEFISHQKIYRSHFNFSWAWALIVCVSMRSPDPRHRGELEMTNKWLHLSSSVSWSLPKTSSVHTVASQFTLCSWFPLRRGSSLCPICSILHHLRHYLPQTAQRKVALPSFNSPGSWVPQSFSWLVSEAAGISDQFLVSVVGSQVSLLGLIINPYLIL